MNPIELAKKTKICKDSKNLVIGKGNINSKILVVGEAPGKNEDEQGLPFVGAAGKNLDKLLEQVGLSLEDVYITNILKCRPPQNRNPTADEIKAHTPWLIDQIKKMKPKVVCSFGNYATKFFLSKGEVNKMKEQQGISKLHCKPINLEFHGLNIRLIPLFHPAAIIYNRKLIKNWEEDMVVVKNETNISSTKILKS